MSPYRESSEYKYSFSFSLWRGKKKALSSLWKLTNGALLFFTGLSFRLSFVDLFVAQHSKAKYLVGTVTDEGELGQIHLTAENQFLSF